MDDQFSVHLSAVKHPQAAIDTAVSSFSGEVHRVDNSEDLETLDLEDGKSHLIIVTLSPTRGKDEATAFATNGKVMKTMFISHCYIPVFTVETLHVSIADSYTFHLNLMCRNVADRWPVTGRGINSH